MRCSSCGRSLQSAYAKTQGFVLKRTAWYLHLRRELYDMQKARNRADICDTCLEYETRGVVQARTAIAACKARVQDCFPNCFEWFDSKGGQVETKAQCTAKYLRDLERYTRNFMVHQKVHQRTARCIS